MYGWIWRHLPSPRVVRLTSAVLLIVLVITALFVWVFPAVEPYMPFNNNTVE
ncbi:MAG: hypothetical protein ACRCTR_09090 [Actinomycetota bacterium]